MSRGRWLILAWTIVAVLLAAILLARVLLHEHWGAPVGTAFVSGYYLGKLRRSWPPRGRRAT